MSVNIDIDPYQILEIDKKSPFTLDQLKAQYKKMVFKYHPDKNPNVASTPLFQILTSAYKTLLKDYELRRVDRPFHELKNASQDFMKTQPKTVNVNLNSRQDNYESVDDSDEYDYNEGSKRFNIKKFNDVFTKTKVDDVYNASGYQDWFTKADVSKEKDMSLVKYREPMSAFGSFAPGFFEFGKENVSDWSGENTKRKDLHFMDCKVAYSTQKLVDESVVKQRKLYKNVEDLEKDRSKISYTMSEKEEKYQKKLQLKQEREEEKRQKAQEKYDRIAHEKHLLSNRLLLGGSRI